MRVLKPHQLSLTKPSIIEDGKVLLILCKKIHQIKKGKGN